MPRDVRALKSLLPPRLFAFLRRLRELWRRLRQLHLGRPRARREAARQEVEALGPGPTISLVMPTYKSNLGYLKQAIDSVRAQHYPHWELCIVDDGSAEPALRALLERQAGAEERIKFEPLAENVGIAAATNAGLELCGGEFVGFLDHDDRLTEDALLRVAQALAADPELDVVYSDSDKLTAHGVRADPFLKPDFSPVYLLGAMYIGHLLVVRRSLAEAAGGFDPAFDTIQDFEFFLRVSERTDRIRHIAQTLYHWRAIPGSIAAGTEQKDDVAELQARAVSEHLRRRGVGARAIPHAAIPHRAVLAPSNGAPAARVGIVVAKQREGGGLDRLLASIEALTEHPSFAVTVVEPDPGPFFRGRANNRGAAEAEGEYLLFCSEDVEVETPGWLGQLLLHAALPRVGAAGPLLARPDGLVAQAGVAIGLREPAGPMLAGFPADGDGYYGSLPCAREVSALSADCMLVRRAEFEALGGFNEFYSSRYEDFDLCRRLAARGLASVYVPGARLVNHRLPAAERAAEDGLDRALFVDCWWDELVRGDPYFNPGFAQQIADYVPAGWRERVYRAAAPLARL
ncbi:MAG TPA: glycosyltransferase [Solirubrobacterales bacterium]